MKYFVFIILLMSSGLTACNTISRGSTDYLRIDTVPQGAKVTTTIETSESENNFNFNAQKTYRSCEPTPCLLEVGRRQSFAIKIEHEGYEPAEIAIHGDIPMRTANLDMAVPAGSVAANIGLGTASGALAGSFALSFAQVLFNPYTIGAAQVPSSGVVAGATAAGAGVGVGMVGLDLMSGSYENIYPNPVIIKLAPEGTLTATDPNMLMFNLRQAKKRVANIYCRGRASVSAKQRRKDCNAAKALDKRRDTENAELLANEQAIKDLIKDLKQKLKEETAKAQAARHSQKN